MTQIVLDVSANTHQNDPVIMEKIFDSVPHVPDEMEVIFKTQYWEPRNECAKVNKTCTPQGLHEFIIRSNQAGYQATASVFDLPSVMELSLYPVPFIKIACRESLYWLHGEIPRKIPVYMSFDARTHTPPEGEKILGLACVPEYPAAAEDYDRALLAGHHISDHSIGLSVWSRCRVIPNRVYECHYVLDRDDEDNPDAGPFAKTPDDLKEMLDG